MTSKAEIDTNLLSVDAKITQALESVSSLMYALEHTSADPSNPEISTRYSLLMSHLSSLAHTHADTLPSVQFHPAKVVDPQWEHIVGVLLRSRQSPEVVQRNKEVLALLEGKQTVPPEQYTNRLQMARDMWKKEGDEYDWTPRLQHYDAEQEERDAAEYDAKVKKWGRFMIVARLDR